MEGKLVIAQELEFGHGEVDKFNVKWNFDDTHIASACSDGTIKVYASHTGSLLKTLNCRQGAEAFPVTSLRWRVSRAESKSKNVLLATTADGQILHWHATSGKLLHSIQNEEDHIYCCEYSPEAEAFAVALKDNSIQIYDESTKQQIQELSPGRGTVIGHSNRIFALKWLENNMLISGGWDNDVILWDCRSGKGVKNMYGPHVCGDSIDARGTLIATGSFTRENQLTLWDIDTGRKVFQHTLMRGENPCMVYATQFSKFDGGAFLAAGGTGSEEIYLFDSNSMQPICVEDLGFAIYSLDFAYTSNRIVLGCGDGSMKILQLQNVLE